MKRPTAERLAGFVKGATGAVIGAAVFTILCKNIVPPQASVYTEIVSGTLPASSQVGEEQFSDGMAQGSGETSSEKPELTVSDELPQIDNDTAPSGESSKPTDEESSANIGPAQRPEPEPPVSEIPTTALVNINTATSEELQTLTGIGEVKAAAIIAYREEHGEFSDISEIMNVSGIGEKIFESIRDRITAGSSSTDKPSHSTDNTDSDIPVTALVNINTASSEELQTLKGIGKVKADAVIAYREEHSGFSDISEIMNVSGIGEKIFEKIQGQITV